MEQNFKGGIYKIVNNITNEIYIGSTVNIKERWRRHKKDLRKGKHHSQILQRAYNKYGENAFTFHVIEFCENEFLIEKENSYFTIFEPKYNICPVANSRKGKKVSDETKEKLRQFAITNNIKPPESTYINKRKKILMLNIENDLIIQQFDSITEACFFLGKTNKFCNTLSSVCNGKRKTAFGYKWKFK